MIISNYKNDKLDLPNHNIIYKPFNQSNFTSFVYLVSSEMRIVIIKNLSEKKIVIYSQQKLRDVIDLDIQTIIALSEINIYHLAKISIITFKSAKQLLAKSLLTTTTVLIFWTITNFLNPKERSSSNDLTMVKQKAILLNGIIIYGNRKQKKKLIKIV